MILKSPFPMFLWSLLLLLFLLVTLLMVSFILPIDAVSLTSVSGCRGGAGDKGSSTTAWGASDYVTISGDPTTCSPQIIWNSDFPGYNPPKLTWSVNRRHWSHHPCCVIIVSFSVL